MILQTILFIFSDLCGLGVFAGDIPRLTGARSAPYENLRALRVHRGEKLFHIWLRLDRIGDFASSLTSSC